MLASEKVDAFYAFLKAKRYADTDPMTIILLSPNHFHPSSTTPQTLCTSSEIYFRQQKYFLTPYPEIACDKQIFFPFGNAITTKEHGIGEHLPRIKRYFPMTKTIIPLVLPTHQRPMLPQEVVLPDHTLVIASVDFSHYLPEAVAQANDTVSISTLQS
ncbi:MAG: AmmeMemoRadiSam system protein B [Candidatus Peribacteria bacterium]|jgi:AmmeMemoRadiSam system protein B|nr:AmmeMemoRadiSam system protein B [Candidatus Peribacteria bacterium]